MRYDMTTIAMKLLLTVLALAVGALGQNQSLTEVVGAEVEYDVDNSTATSDRRALDLAAPGTNGADDTVVKKYGHDYFQVGDEVLTSTEKQLGLGVIQKVSRTAAPPPPVVDGSVPISPWLPDSLDVPMANASGIEWLLDVYNPHRWQAEALPGAATLGAECKIDLQTYLRALRNGSSWAAKMNDASGRYASQFFFGNDFWLGSHSLCSELENPRANAVVPPFPVNFHVAVLHIRLPAELTPRGRQIYLGVCLPRSCLSRDVTALLQPSPENAHSLRVVRVRPVPGEYRLWRDPQLHFLITVTGLLLLLIVAGTAYENHLERQQRHRDRRPPGRTHVPTIDANADDKLASPLDMRNAMGGDRGNFNSNSDISTADSFREPISVAGQVLLSFSALSNARKILHCGEAPKDALTCVHGLRFLSLAWVILVHTYLQCFAIAENKTIRTLTERNLLFQTVSNATFSVDSFFLISGLLVTYLYLKTSRNESSNHRTMSKGGSHFQNGAKKFFMLLGYRFIRLTPSYMFVLMAAGINMRNSKSSSVFEAVSQDDTNCVKYWWRNALYINSLYPKTDMCMLWSWYMANDTQFYAIGILLLLVSSRHARMAVVGFFAFLVTSWLVTGLISINYGYKVRVEQPFALFDELYDKPWTRLGPYLVGMFAGWFLFTTKCKVQISKFTVVACWILSLSVLASLVYGVLNAQLGVTGSALYVALGHTAWGLALGWIVIACCTGHGGYINTALSCRLLHPLSRLTYCAYLVHPVFMTTIAFHMDGPLHIHNALMVVLYFGNTVASFLLSFMISMVYEAPVVRLLKLALSPKPRRTNSMEE